MSKAIRGLASTKLLPVWVVLAGALALVLLWPEPPAALAQEPDGDGDGVPDSVEIYIGTDPADANSDSDSWTDGEELWIYGTDPLQEDTDGDALLDHDDPSPLLAGPEDGDSNITRSYSSNLAHETLTGTSPFEGVNVNVSSGEFLWSDVMGFGPSVLRGGARVVILHRTGVQYDGEFGRSNFSNLSHTAEEQQDSDVVIQWFGIEGTFDESGGSYSAPAGWPFTLSKDAQNGEFVLTEIRGGMQHVFDVATGYLLRKEDRFGNTESYTRDGWGNLTQITTAEGLTISVSTYTTGRVSDLTGPGNRGYHVGYNVKGGISYLRNPEGEERQYFQVHGSSTADLNHNMTRVLDEVGRTVVENRFDTSDRVVKQIRGSDELTIDYDAPNNQATVTDWSGNDRKYTFGSPVATQVVVYSNRNVNSADPTSWTWNFTYNSNYLRTKTVFPRGNSIVYTWDSNYCLTQKRMKQDDTQQDDNNNDLIWSYTYGSTYYQLKNSTDPRGNTTQRTLDSLERVTQVTYPTITHPDPDETVTESFTWNSDGTIATATDGEGAVTKYEYYGTGSKKGLLYRVTRDYGTGKLNLQTIYDYDTARFKTSETDPDGNTWTFTVDDMGRVTKETSPSSLDYETSYTFNAAGQVTQKDVENVDETGTRVTSNPWWTTSFAYDSLGRLSSVEEEITSGTTRTTSYTYTGNGEVLVTTLPEGNKVKNVWDERGRLHKRIRGFSSADEASEEYTYDANGNLVTRKDGRGKSWTSTFDLFDRKTKETMPGGEYTSYVLDKSGNVTEVKRYDGQDTLLAHTKHHYDEMDRLYETERWLDHASPTPDEWLATSFDLDGASRVTTVTDPLGHDTDYTYDGAGRRTAVTDHLGNEVTWGYSGDCCSATEIEEVEVKPGGGTETFRTELVVDALNRVTERRIVNRDNSADKHVFKTKYTSLSVAVEEEDAEGNKTAYEHDGLGRVTKKEVDLGSGNKIETWFTFDENGNQTKLKDDKGNETTWTVNARDLPTKITYADTNDRSFSYNGDDTLAGWTDENGTVVTNSYNDNGWLTSRSIQRAANVLGPTSESYSYDGLGRLTAAENDNSVVEFDYDTLSRLESETQGPNPLGQNGKTITWTYDDDGSRATAEYFSGYDLTYTVDAVGRWTKIEDASSNDLVTWSYYGPARRIGQASYLNGTTETRTWDGFRRVTDVDHEDSQQNVFAGFDYAYDKMGNPLYEERTHDSGKGDAYAYDKAYRLTAALIGSNDPSAEIADGDWLDYAYQKTIDYNMDDVSNRTSVVETPYGQQGASTGYTSNSVNWYTAVGGVSRTHDANGNLRFDGTYDYFYDYRNNLVRVEEDSAVVAEYEFDALNRRTKKTVGSDVTKFFYDGEHVVEEYDGSGNLLRKFVYGQRIDEIRVMIAPDVADVDDDQNTTEVLDFYYHTNMLGSVTHVTGPNETVVEQYEYSPYGKTTIKDGQGNDLSGQSAIGNPYMYTARRFDEEPGLYHYRRRAYDPDAGRFLQRDPLLAIDWKKHEYCSSSPAARVDPSGLKDIEVKPHTKPQHADGTLRPPGCVRASNGTAIHWEAAFRFKVARNKHPDYNGLQLHVIQLIDRVDRKYIRPMRLERTSIERITEAFAIDAQGNMSQDVLDYHSASEMYQKEANSIGYCRIWSQVEGTLWVGTIADTRAASDPGAKRMAGGGGEIRRVSRSRDGSKWIPLASVNQVDTKVKVKILTSFKSTTYRYRANVNHCGGAVDRPCVDHAGIPSSACWTASLPDWPGESDPALAEREYTDQKFWGNPNDPALVVE